MCWLTRDDLILSDIREGLLVLLDEVLLGKNRHLRRELLKENHNKLGYPLVRTCEAVDRLLEDINNFVDPARAALPVEEVLEDCSEIRNHLPIIDIIPFEAILNLLECKIENVLRFKPDQPLRQ